MDYSQKGNNVFVHMVTILTLQFRPPFQSSHLQTASDRSHWDLCYSVTYVSCQHQYIRFGNYENQSESGNHQPQPCQPWPPCDSRLLCSKYLIRYQLGMMSGERQHRIDGCPDSKKRHTSGTVFGMFSSYPTLRAQPDIQPVPQGHIWLAFCQSAFASRRISTC